MRMKKRSAASRSAELRLLFLATDPHD